VTQEKQIRDLIKTETSACITVDFTRLNCAGRVWHSHRLALALATGENRLASTARRRCGNDRCINPKHLYWDGPKQMQKEEREHYIRKTGRAPAEEKVEVVS
jgi:hypothetical protein